MSPLPVAGKLACQSKGKEPCSVREKEERFTPGGAAIGRVNFLPINFKCPASWNIDIRGLLDIYNLRSS